MWSFPASVGKFTLYGKSRAAHNTAFVVPELGLALDCGVEVKEIVCQHVCLTHTHTDHVKLLAVASLAHAPALILCVVPRLRFSVSYDHSREKQTKTSLHLPPRSARAAHGAVHHCRSAPHQQLPV